MIHARLPLATLVAWGLLGCAGANHAPATHTVEIRGLVFLPANLDARVGDTVVFVNHDIVPHTATASGVAAWDTDTIANGQERRVVVTAKGVTEYFCRLHPGMKGTVRVKA